MNKQGNMLITINYLLIYLYTVNGLRKEVLSVENDKSNNSDEPSDERTPSRSFNKNSNENEIVLSSCSSDSSENNQATDLPKQAKREERNNTHHEKMLNSYEETKTLWSEPDKYARDKFMIESQNGINHTKTLTKPNDPNEPNFNNNNILLATKNGNIYPEKMLNYYETVKQNREDAKSEIDYVKETQSETERQQVQKPNQNIYPEKMEGENLQRTDTRNENTKPEAKPSYVETDSSERIPKTYRNSRKDSQQKRLDNNNYSKELLVSFRNTKEESEETQNETFEPQIPAHCSGKIQQEYTQNQNDETTRLPDCSPEKGRRKNHQPGDMKVSRSSRHMVHEGSQSNTIQEYIVDTGAVASRNSTIEVSDREGQESMAAEENDDEDKSTLVDYPYTVSVQRKGAHYASGALVGERWVLSTAAEFYNVRETIKLYRMRLGSVDCKKGGIITAVKSIVVHPNFVQGRPSYDVAVLGMAEPVPISSVIKPIGLSRVGGEVMSAKFLTTYWPRIVVKEAVLPPAAKERIKYNSMRVSTQKLIFQQLCIRQLATVNITLDKSSLCLKPVDVHHSVCMPDVGAPVVAVDGLWGITSGWTSPLCPSVPMPTIFTRVSAPDLRTWVDSQMVI